MGRALDLAREAGRHGDVPIGAVVLDAAGSVIGAGMNRREVDADPLAHAEMLAMRSAAGATRTAMGRSGWNLSGCTLVVTLEPCPMCAGALMLSHIDSVLFGAWDAKVGACGSVWDLPRDPHAGYAAEVRGGVRERECAELLASFFADRRHRA